MVYSETAARRTTHRPPIHKRRASGALVAIVALAAALGLGLHRSSSPSTLSSPSATRAPSSVPLPLAASAPVHRPHHVPSDALGEAGGGLPDATSVFDSDLPGIANLKPALLRALRRAATDAGGAGVGFVVNSGWRSPAYEDELRRQAVAKYGSEAEAARWVATGSTSPHVSGDAVDIGPTSAAAWLTAHGAAYGLCQIYANEPWHYELRPAATAHGCPAMYADPTQDPRMH